jgi:hypothetical protein
LGSTTTCFSIGFVFLFLNIFCISLYLKKSMILCPVSPQIWQEYLTGLYTWICWIVTSETKGIGSSFLLTLHVSTLWFVLWQFVQYIPISLELSKVFELILFYYFVVLTNYYGLYFRNSFFTNQSCFPMLLKSFSLHTYCCYRKICLYSRSKNNS